MCMRFRNSGRYFGMKRALEASFNDRMARADKRKPASTAYFGHFRDTCGLLTPRLTHEGSNESATSAVQFPIDVQPRPAIGISQSYSGYRVSQLRQRRIKGYFVAAQMVFVIYRTGPHGGELPGSQQRRSVMF